LVFSILGDLFPVGHRSEMAVVPGMAMGIGQLVGQAMAGFVGPAYGWCVS
jgi:MFS family permease